MECQFGRQIGRYMSLFCLMMRAPTGAQRLEQFGNYTGGIALINDIYRSPSSSLCLRREDQTDYSECRDTRTISISHVLKVHNHFLSIS